MNKTSLFVTVALVLMCTGPIATAQTYGNVGPRRADTTDPNSIPGGWARSQRGYNDFARQREYNAYARGDATVGYSRRSMRMRGPAEPDPAFGAQRNTALFLQNAFNPWAATSRSAGPR
jgi:hypothetical protein